MKVAVIPARGGSKRIPRKNIKSFFGKPMLAWSIEAAIKSKCFDRVIVSTDDDEVAEIAKQYGAEVPFLRPLELSNDYVGTGPVVVHAINWLKESHSSPSYVCCIYATAPFLQVTDLQCGLNELLINGAKYSFSATSFAAPIQRAFRIKSGGYVEMFEPENFNKRSQDLESAFHDAGQFCWGVSDAWLNGTPVFSAETIAIELPRFRVQDIDTLEDWHRAELMFSALQAQQLL